MYYRSGTIILSIDLAGKVIRVVIQMRGTDLYAMQFSD
jgi:hypothetical protein